MAHDSTNINGVSRQFFDSPSLQKHGAGNGSAMRIYARVQAVIEHGIQKLPPYKGKVMRGYLALTTAELQQYQPGSVIQYAALTSWSRDAAYEEKTQFVIVKSSQGKDVSVLNDNYEGEVLFTSPIRYRVVSVSESIRGHVLTIYLQDLP